MTQAANPVTGSRRWRRRLRDRISENRSRMEFDLVQDLSRRRLSSPVAGMTTDAVVEALRSHAEGRVLDAGCGYQPFRGVIEEVADEYRSVDVEYRVPGVDYLAELENLDALSAETFDTVICSEVLEHVARPGQALGELARVLCPGGVLILSVPFLARLHEEPHDYFRYTAHGLRFLLKDAGLEVVEIRALGSLATFLGHQLSTILLVALWHRRWLRELALMLNARLVVGPARTIDRWAGIGDLLPCGYLAVARKPSGG